MLFWDRKRSTIDACNIFVMPQIVLGSTCSPTQQGELLPHIWAIKENIYRVENMDRSFWNSLIVWKATKKAGFNIYKW